MAAIWMFLLVGCCHLISSARCDDYYKKGKFVRTESNLTEVPVDIKDGALVVDLSYNEITVIKNNSFIHLTNCTNLNLTGNRISLIEPDAFKGLTNLQSVDIAGNLLTEVTSDVFKHTPSLRSIYLNDINISVIHSRGFNGLVNLEFLHIYDNRLTDLKMDMFKDLEKCTDLRLYTNQISVIEPGTFSGLANLKTLYLYDYRLTELKMDTFKELVKCTHLYLSENQISVIQPGTFNGLFSLESLELHDNELTELKTNIFKDLGLCTKLYLNKNQISVLKPGAFNGLVNLKSLHLFENELTELKMNMFQDLVKCNVLGLWHNQISSIQPRAFIGMENLQVLDFSLNQLTHLRADMFIGLQSLEKLNLLDNKLTKLSTYVFSNLPRPLSLALGDPTSDQDSKLQCDADLCWLKQEELDGTIKWFSIRDELYKPECSNGDDWETINCTETGACVEPGGVKHAVISGATWPYNVGSVVTYICDSCYSGGGTITCQSNGNWTKRQTCEDTVLECSDPQPASHGTYKPSTAPHRCGSTVTYTCDAGYKLIGDNKLMCSKTGEWTGNTPICAMLCSDPASVAHASVEPSTGPYRPGDVVTYTCDAEYKLIGNRTMMCSETGKWTETLRFCIETEASPGFLVTILVGVGSGICGSIITAIIVVVVCLNRKRKQTQNDTGHMNPAGGDSIQMQPPGRASGGSMEPQDRDSMNTYCQVDITVFNI